MVNVEVDQVLNFVVVIVVKNKVILLNIVMGNLKYVFVEKDNMKCSVNYIDVDQLK